MASVSPADPRPISRRVLASAQRVGLLIAGVLFDFCALINVPGTTAVGGLMGGAEITLTDLGTAIAFLVLAAWPTLLWSESRPWITAAAGAALAVVGVSYLLLLLGAMACLRRYPSRVRVIGIPTVAVVVLFAVRESVSDWGGALLWLLTRGVAAPYEPLGTLVPWISAVVAVGTCATIVLARGANERVERSDARAAEQEQRADELAERVVRQAERDRIARDVHDALAHRLSVVSLHAGALEARAADGDGAAEIARTVREQTHAALQDMRGLIGDLRNEPGRGPTSPATMGGIGALLTDLRASGAVLNTHVFLVAPERASAQLGSAVYRIVQEALTNAVRSAHGSAIDVFVQVEPVRGARIRVANPLIGSTSLFVLGGGHGIVGIRERAGALGGTAWIGPDGETFLVDVTLPWQAAGGGDSTSR